MMRKRIGIFIIAFVLALTAGITVACGVKVPTKTKTYTVTYYYNYDGAPTDGIYREDTVKDKTAAQKPADPTRTDYTFDKWTTDTAGNKEYVFADQVIGDVKLYAQWTQNSPQVTFSSIEITSPPTKLTYVQGEELDLTGMVVTAKYSDNSGKTVANSECTVTGYDKTKLGAQNITVTYNKKTARFTVTVVAPAVDHIEITTEPNDKEYLEGDELDLTGLVVTAYYENETSEVVTDYEVEGYNSTKIGEQTITVKYGGKTAQFTVTVKAVEIIGIEVTKFPTKREYEVGDALDLTGMEITVKYSDESEEVITKGYTTSGYVGTQEGTCTITVKYRGFDDTFTVHVTQVTYTVTFKTGVNGIAAPAAQTVNKNANATDPTTAAIQNRAGYTFDGWFETGAQTAYVFTTAVTKDITLTAKWTKNTYTITYVIDNDGAGDPLATAPTTNLTYDVESAFSLPRPTAIKSGYNFLGWYSKYTEVDGVKTYADADKVPSIQKGTTGNKTFYAYIDEKATYTFTFNYNYGDTPEVYEDPVTEGNKPAALAENPTRTGYTFGGWYTTAECTTAYNFNVNIEDIAEEDRVAYAKWTAKTIEVQFQNGDAVTTVDVAFDEVVTAPTAPTKLGHHFDGWFMLDETEWNFANKLCEVLDKESLTLVAGWTANKYDVVFKPDNGSADITVANITFGTAIPAEKMLADPTKTGYDFDGWYTSANVKWTANSKLNTEGLELTAKWNAKSYTVTFDVNGGAPAVTAKTVKFGDPIPAPTTAPTKAGHTLDGWYYNNGTADVKWNFATDTLQTAANFKLTAKWTAKDVVVKFVDSDKTTVLGTKNIKYGEKVTALDPEPTKEHYEFWHWHMLDGETVWDFANMVVEREGEGDEAGLLTLVAHWNAKQYNVAFVLGDKAEFKTAPAAKYTYGTVYNLPSSDNINIKTKGYSFLGWYDNAQFSGDPVTTIAVGTSGDKTYYAYVTQNATVNFTYNHGYQGIEDRVDTVVQGTKKTDNYTPTRTGWKFEGWYTTNELKVLYNFDDDVMVATTVYAKWTINTYTITFNANGGAFANNELTAQKTFTSAEATTDLAASAYPTRTGYTFKYWYIEDDTTAYTFGGQLTENVTLKAKWQINEYTVAFNTDGGSAIGDRKVNYNNPVSKPNDPTKAGHTFKGWYKEAALTNAWTFSGENADKVTDNITLYAKWEINEYTVTFNVNGGTGTVAPQTVEYNQSATKPTQTITKTGYHLKANEEWKKEDGTVWNFTTSKVTDDITLYANWEINTYTVTFQVNGGSAVQAQTVEHGKKVTKPADPTREGWTFGGWNLNGSAYNFETATVTGDITLSAVWSGKTGTYLYVSDADGDNWNAAYPAVWEKNEYNRYQWKVTGVELYAGMQFLVVTYGSATGGTGDTWLHAADEISQWTFGDVITIDPLKDGDTYNFKVSTYNEHYVGAKWTLYIGGLNKQDNSATLSSEISFAAEYDNELRDPSNTGKTIVKTLTPNSDVKVYLRGNFTDEFSLAEAWSTNSQIIKVLNPSDSTVYTFRKVYLKKGDAFKAYFTGMVVGESDNGWYGGVFTGLNSKITLSSSGSDIYLGSITNGYYDIIIDSAAYTLKIIAYAEPTTASIAVTTKPTKVTYWQGEPFSSNGMVVTVTNTDGDTTTVTADSCNITNTATNVLGKKTVTVTYDGKTATFEITVNELKVTFNANGGSNVTAQSVLYNGKATNPTTTKTGYDFGGWFDNADCTGTAYDFNTSVTAPLTLYAKWTTHQYDVKFFNDDGTTQLGETVKVPYNTAIPANKVPTATKAGHTFAAWKNGTNDYTLTALVTSDLNLIASFTINSYEVKLVFHDKTTTTNINYGGKVSKPNDSETDRDGYTFDGWFNNAVSTTEQYNFATLVTGPITLTAKWTVITYTITYNVAANGTAPANGTYTIEDAVTLAIPTGITAGYTFMGWCNNAELTGTPVFTIAKGSMGNRDYYAKITQNATVNLTFNYNYGDTPETTTVPVVSGTAGEALDPAPTRTGYTFTGWYEEAEGTTAYTFPTMTANKTVYAKWEINKHSVTFNTLGGSAVATLSEVAYGATITAPTAPTRTGYDFGGWYKENTFTTAWKFDGETDADTMPDADITLYAKWVINEFTVTFESNGGSTVAAYTKVQKNATISAPAAPTKTGYDFGGWYKEAALTNKWTFAGETGTADKVTADITLYAKWTIKKFTVTFDSNGGSAVASYTDVEYGTTITAPTKPTKVGYDFISWQKDGTAYSWSAQVTGNITLVAKWEVHEYTVNYYVGAGANHADNSTTYTVEMGTEGVVTLEDAVPPTGYDFSGWFTAEENGTRVETISLDDFVGGDEINLHAKYTIKTFVVTFDLNYTGAGANPTVTVDYNTAVPTADIPNPTRADYDFGGWFTDKACSVGKAWVKTTKITTTITVYAKWTPTVREDGVYADGVFVKKLESNSTDNKQWKVENAALPAGAKLTFWWKGAQSTANVYVRGGVNNGEMTGTDYTNITVVTGGYFNIYYNPAASGDNGLWVVYNGAYVESNLQTGDGVYVGGTLVKAFVLHTDGANQVRATDVNITAANDTTAVEVTFKYGGTTVTLAKVDLQEGITNAATAPAVKLYSGTYNFYYNYGKNNDGVAGRMWIEGTQTGGAATLTGNWYIAGSFNSWGDAVGNEAYKFSAQGKLTISLKQNALFKVTDGSTWKNIDSVTDATSKTYVVSDGSNDKNLKVTQDGKYEIVFNGSTIKVTRLGDYEVVITPTVIPANAVKSVVTCGSQTMTVYLKKNGAWVTSLSGYQLYMWSNSVKDTGYFGGWSGKAMEAQMTATNTSATVDGASMIIIWYESGALKQSADLSGMKDGGTYLVSLAENGGTLEQIVPAA